MKMRLIDIHSHVNFNVFREDSDEVMKRTMADNVGQILVGAQYDTSLRAVEFAEKYGDGVWAAVGLHPIHLDSFEVDDKEIAGDVKGFKTRPEEFDYKKYKELASHKKVVAIGECGLDYYRSDKKEIQHKVFREHVRLARDVKKPMIIHCRNAYDDLYQILKEEKGDEVGGTIHFFAGTWADAQKFLDLGFHLSFTGVITFADDYNESIINAPLDRIMVETDAPYVAPAAYRGKRNEPLYVEEITKKVAELRGISYEEVAKATTNNAIKLFSLD
ncbi:MAG: TatD family hydrolase [bacterium]|nr:TatD family hydrolase [bacterium]